MSRTSSLASRIASCVAACVIASCGGSGPECGDRATGAGLTSGVVGTVLFEKRTIDDRGILSSAANAVLVPAAFVRVEIVDGGCVHATVTNEAGEFGIDGPFADGHEVLAYPEVPVGIAGVAPVRVYDRERRPYAVSSGPRSAVAAGDRSVVTIIAAADSELRISGAFNIVETMRIAGEIWSAATGVAPSEARVKWASGGDDQPGTFFSPGVNEISILGGRGVLQDSTDTDEFDDVVVAHEYFHFLQSNHAFSSSPGGRHSGEELIPSLAFEEGLADWFGAFVSGTSLYQDTIGTDDGVPRCAICDDLEDSTLRTVEGIGSEQSTYEILWDLADGRPGQPADVDTDGVSVDVAEILSVITGADPSRDHFSLSFFLDRLVAAGAISTSAVQSVVTAPTNHDLTFPAVDREVPSSGKDVFPVPIGIGEAKAGSASAPTGFAANTERSFDSVRYYHLEIPSTRTVTITLTIDGTGRPPSDLDLRLQNNQGGVLAVSAGSGPTETITATLDPGRYVIAVFAFFISDAGGVVPNAAAFTLEVD